jgi:hypothetical protein
MALATFATFAAFAAVRGGLGISRSDGGLDGGQLSGDGVRLPFPAHRPKHGLDIGKSREILGVLIEEKRRGKGGG